MTNQNHSISIFTGSMSPSKALFLRLENVFLLANTHQIIEIVSQKANIETWNTNVAWIRAYELSNHKAQALLMRDTDIDFKSVFIAKEKSGIKSIQDLKGKKFGLGSADSAQAAILPLKYLENELGESIKDVEIIRYNSDLGRHGDTGRSEFDVLEDIKNGKLDAGAIGISTWVRVLEEGLFPAGGNRVFLYK